MDNIKYELALQELESIAAQLERGECNIDELTAMIRRAKELSALCKSKLRRADEEVKEIISGDDGGI